MIQLPPPLAAFGEYDQFMLYKLVPTPGGKTNKIPIDPRTLTTYPKDGDWQNDPTATVPFGVAAALATTLGAGYGVGFLFTDRDPFWFLDADHCITDAGWSPVAADLLGRLSGCAVEISQSGAGIHIYGTGTPPPGHVNRNQPLGLEFYTRARFVALTLNCPYLGAATHHPDMSVIAGYFPPRVDGPMAATWTTEPCAEWYGLDDDDELIRKAISTKAGAAASFGDGATFRDLWNADVAILCQAYPDLGGERPYDGSQADAALAQHLAFWTGKNCERTRSLMMRSGLMREKYNREDYLQRTVLMAVGRQKTVYNNGRRPIDVLPDSVEFDDTPRMVAGNQYMPATLQMTHFKGCIYIQDLHRVMTPSGYMLKSEQFDVTFGGYTFQLNDDGQKTTKRAWEAFTVSQCVRYPIANSTCFRPEQPPGKLVREESRVLVNTYVPIDIDMREGDVGPFLTHVRKLLPNDQDRAIVMAYMAACVQYKGTKFQWAPLLQGTEGNGKTLLSRCVAHAVGHRYTHFPKADTIGERFNAWVAGKLFIGIEDVYVPEHKREVIENLKPLITNDRVPIEAKGVDQVTGDNRANFILNSNHKDAVNKHRGDRRFAMFFTAQQTIDDLRRDEMDNGYFPRLYDWLRGGGYAIVAHYLSVYPIPDELNPATSLDRAPVTSSTEEAVQASLGMVEQEILHALDDNVIGFRGGVVSSTALDRLLTDIRRNVPRNKRRDLMRSIGYDWHPDLIDGRMSTVSPVISDGGKRPVLFVQRGTTATAADVVARYIEVNRV